jgi:hypothetical protein
MSAVNEEARASRDQTIGRIRWGTRAAQLRDVLDEVRGRQTPEAVVRLARLTMPTLPSPLDGLRSPEGKLRTDPELRRNVARYLRREIRSAQLRVVLDRPRGRRTPEAVRRLAQTDLPSLS